jgi:enoyl-[acyl-carrier protein] reductase I
LVKVAPAKRRTGMSFEGLMKGKCGLIMGVANQHSIAWGIAQALHGAGAELAFTYQGDLFKKRVTPLVEPLKPAALIDCDVSSQASIDAAFAELKTKWDTLDFLVHAIAFSDKEQLKGRYVDTTADNFRMTMDISVYSFTAVAQRAEKMMPGGGSMLTLTYYGSEKVTPHYNVMGVAKAALEASVRYLAEDLGKKKIRVNAVSAGPIKTLAFAGIADSRYILKWNELNSPLRRTVTQGEVGNSALFLLSDLGSAVTGECLHVDAGYHVVGMKAEDAPDMTVTKSDI